MRTTKTLAAFAALAALGFVQPAFAATDAKPKAAASSKEAKHHRHEAAKKAASTAASHKKK